MKHFSYGDSEPIAALATPLGESALAVIRTSGGTAGATDSIASAGNNGTASAIGLIALVFSRPKNIKTALGNTVIHGWITDPITGKKIDEVLVSVFRSPKSYTGEDCVDIFCHGSIAVIKAIMTALKAVGFRDALPGEFSFRAFMNSKLDLTRAESVMELVCAKTNTGREQAVRRLSGILEKEINEIKNLLTDVLAGTEIYLDYSEDEFSGVSADEQAGRLPDKDLAQTALEKLQLLVSLWKQERIYSEGALAVIAGRPNAGKSSLFNYLIREDRSIVTNTPGTTRDWIEALIAVEDIPLRLADTAGLRDLGKESDEAEQLGIKRTFELLDTSDLVLYIIDGVKGIDLEDRNYIKKFKETNPEKILLLIWNKADLAKPPLHDLSVLLPLSAKTGEGITELLCAIADHLKKGSSSRDIGHAFSESPDSAAGPGTVRQKELIEQALISTQEALALSDNGEPLDIIAPLFRTAIDSLGEITGEVSTDDILEKMFSRFCVGK